MDYSDMEYNDRVEGGVGKQAEDIFEQHLTDPVSKIDYFYLVSP